MRLSWFVLLTLPTAALAQPADFSPYPALTIRTLGVENGGISSAVKVLVGNGSQAAIDVRFSCTLYDEGASPSGEASGIAEAVPPSQEVVDRATASKGNHSNAVCRITSFRPTE